MITVRPFEGVRPPRELVKAVASKPYDVLSSQEALKESQGNEKSLYHIIKPEINFSPMIDEHDERVYANGVENYLHFRSQGWLLKDESPAYYIYAQQMGVHKQYGLVVTASIDDYLEGRIKKHELTRVDKELDRMRHVYETKANIEPVFLAFRKHQDLESLIQSVVRDHTPIYDFRSDDGILHQLWVVTDAPSINQITTCFADIDSLYIADGHHRSAAAARVGEQMRQQDSNTNDRGEYNYFMAVCFPEDQLYIMDYNRLVRDLNGLTPGEFLTKLSLHFEVSNPSHEPLHPQKKYQFSLYLAGQWYLLTAKPQIIHEEDVIANLDVSILSTYVLNQLLGIEDLRTSKRIDFVGGIRGYAPLKERVDSGEMQAAFGLYPVSMGEIMAVSDKEEIMPPKTTWFEPKLRSGLIIHDLI